MTAPFDPHKLRELHEAALKARATLDEQRSKSSAIVPMDRAMAEAVHTKTVLDKYLFDHVEEIIALADRLQEADAVAEAARKFQPILKALRPWEASAKQLSELADYDSELPSILKESGRALYDAVENYNHLNAERHASRTRERREG